MRACSSSSAAARSTWPCAAQACAAPRGTSRSRMWQAAVRQCRAASSSSPAARSNSDAARSRSSLAPIPARNSTEGVRPPKANKERPMETPRPDPAATDPEVEGFLALLAARRAPKTVEAYRRDLRALGDWLGGPPSRATHEDLERWLAELRAAGLSPA